MSLFKTRDFWETTCSEEETFDQHSLLTTSLDGGISEKIILGSHSGYLRIFQPKAIKSDEDKQIQPLAYKPTDLLLETKLDLPIYQIKSGKLISGSQHNQLCILHPRSVAIYNFHIKTGEIEHGNQSRLVLAYEHNLKHSSYCMVLGNFGGVTGRDFLCVQSLDGVLSFFEQESFSFTSFLPQFLLPGPLAYLHFNDSFITVSSNWHVECYRYQNLAENGNQKDPDSNTGRKLNPDWFYNIGEAALDISISTVSSTIHIIAILGERNLYFLSEKGMLKTMKRLDYTPMCFSTFIREPEAKYMIMIVSDSNNLMIYENISLKWVSNLEFTPVAISRINIQEFQGALVLLSDSGHLQCCYLGTNPSLFIVPPMEVRNIDYVESAKYLESLQKELRNYARENSETLANNASEMGIKVKVTVENDLEPCTYPFKSEYLEYNPPPSMCAVHVDLEPSIPLSDVHVAFSVEPPISVGQSSHVISSLCDTVRITTHAFVSIFDCPICSLDISVAVSYHNSEVPRVVVSESRLPLQLVLEVATPSKEANYKLTLNMSRTTVNPTLLFPEFYQEKSTDTSLNNAFGFQLITGRQTSLVSILVAKSSQRYRLQSDSFPLLCLIVDELQRRLSRQKQDVNLSYQSPLPFQELNERITKHFEERFLSQKLEEELSLQAAQYRRIQKRMLEKYRDKTPTPLTSLDTLLKETVQIIFNSTKKFEQIRDALTIARIELNCTLSVIFMLAKLTPGSDSALIDNLKDSLLVPADDMEEEGWEDNAYAAVVHLLQTKLLRSRDRNRINPDFNDPSLTMKSISDITKLKKLLAICLDRVLKPESNESGGNEKEITKTMPAIEEQAEDSIAAIDEDSILPPSTDLEGTVIVPEGSRIAERSVSAKLKRQAATNRFSQRPNRNEELNFENDNNAVIDEELERNEIKSEEKRDWIENESDPTTTTTTTSSETPRPTSSQPKMIIESPPEIFSQSHDDDIW